MISARLRASFRMAQSKQPKPPRVAVENRADGGVLFWIGRLYLFLAVVVAGVLALVGLSAYRYFVITTPAPPELSEYAKVAPAVTRVYAADGTKLGEFA